MGQMMNDKPVHLMGILFAGMGYTTFSDAPNISQNRIIGLNPHCILNSHQYSKL